MKRKQSIQVHFDKNLRSEIESSKPIILQNRPTDRPLLFMRRKAHIRTPAQIPAISVDKSSVTTIKYLSEVPQTTRLVNSQVQKHKSEISQLLDNSRPLGTWSQNNTQSNTLDSTSKNATNMNYDNFELNYFKSSPNNWLGNTRTSKRNRKGKSMAGQNSGLTISKEALWAQSLAELDENANDFDDEVDGNVNVWQERLEIPNFWKTFTGVSLARRIIWIFIFLFSFGLFMLQTADRINRLVDPPKSSTVQLAYEPELSFPLMTICPSYKFRASLLQKFNVDRFGCKPGQRYCSWDIPYNLATHTETIIKLCTYKKHFSCSPGTEDSGKWRRTITSLGRCFTFEATEPIRSAGDSNAFEIQVDPILWDKCNGSGIRVYIHGRNEIPLVEVTGININHGSGGIFALQVKEFDRVNDLRRDQCVTAQNYSQSRCIMRCVYDLVRDTVHGKHDNTSCGAPFMQSFDIRACNVKETIENFIATYEQTINNGTAWNNCNVKCPEPCKQRTYTPITTSLGFSNTINSSLVNITIYFSDMWVERIIEHWDYNFEEFIADTGGSLNLFLGASFVSIIQFSDYFLAMFALWVRKFMTKMKSLQNKVLVLEGSQRNINAIEVSW